jgi:hypothetical protein
MLARRFQLVNRPGTAASVKYKFEMFQIDGLNLSAKFERMWPMAWPWIATPKARRCVIISGCCMGLASLLSSGVNMHLKQLLDEARTAAYIP